MSYESFELTVTEFCKVKSLRRMAEYCFSESYVF